MSHVLVEKREHILLIGLNRPEKYNALTRAMYHDIAKAYYQLEHDPELRVGVLYGVGDHMTAGLELTDWVEVFSSGQAPTQNEGELDPFYMVGPPLSKPVVMAVQGYCYTCGVELLLNTDIRVAASNTRFGQLEVARGFFACGGATMRLPREIGWGNAQRYLLTGETWTAEQSYQWGLVQNLVEPGRQLEVALEVAAKVAKAAPLGVKGSLASSKLARTEGEQAAKDVIYQSVQGIMSSEDMKEGIASFMQRREANFKGR